MATYNRTPEAVVAEQYVEDGEAAVISTIGSEAEITDGGLRIDLGGGNYAFPLYTDWVVRHADTTLEVMSDTYFQANYTIGLE